MMSRLSPPRRSLFFLFVLFLTVPAFSQESTAKFDAYFKTLVGQNLFSGSVLIARNGNVIFSKGYAMANLELEVSNTPQTKFRLGSITKQFTAAAILLLQERGKLKVQDSICKYLDGCPDVWREVTIHHLLSHTSGITNFTNFPDYPKTMMMPTTIESVVARFKDKPLDFKPMEKWNYSNSGYILLGLIVEKASGESYENFLQKNIFTPLKLNNTGYDHTAAILKNRATGYSQSNGGAINSPYLEMDIPFAAGALYSTTEDLFLWNEALFSDRLLSAASRTAMTTVVKENYAYGVGLNQLFNRQMVSHGGGINGFATYLARFPAEKVTIVVLSNRDYGQPSPGKISQEVAAILFGEKIDNTQVQTPVKVDSKIYDAYVGEYQLAPAFIITITRNGEHLMAQATNQPQFEIFPESETKFFLKVVNAQISFIKDQQGKVTHLILHQGGDKQGLKIK